MDYWKYCIEEAFDEAGITATKEQIDIVAGRVENGYENYGMAHGYDCIPNPMNLEVEDVKREMAELKDRHERQLSGVIKGVARRRNVGIESVYIDDSGNVTYKI